MYRIDPLDLSPLDPMRDPGHWEELVERTLERVNAVLAHRRRDPLSVIVSWRRALVVAAACFALVLVPVEILLEKREREVEPVRNLAEFAAQTAYGGRLPTGAELSRTLRLSSLP